MGNMDAHFSRLILIMAFIIQNAIKTASSSSQFRCYVCSVSSKKYRLDSFDPCIKNATSLYTQECTPPQKFCKIKKTLRYNQIISLERNCASTCERGCLRYTYAMWKVTCTDCCNQSECNVEGGVSRSEGNYWLIMITMLSAHILACLASEVIGRRLDNE